LCVRSRSHPTFFAGLERRGTPFVSVVAVVVVVGSEEKSDSDNDSDNDYEQAPALSS